MKLYIEYSPNESGKGKFISRLVPELEKLGVKVSYKPEGCDISLCLTRFRTKFKGPRVLRVDGIHLVQSKKTIWNNERVKKCINKADAVIWQSDFCRNTAKRVLGVKPKKEYRIYNGASPDEFFKHTNHYYPTVLIFGNFADRKHKRLKEMLELAERINSSNKKLCWEVAGNIDEEFKKKLPKVDYVNYRGHIGRDAIRLLLSRCRLVLDLQTAAWCPNVVVEALVAGCPVVGCKGAGNEELIGYSGALVYDEPPTRMMKNEKYYKLDIDKVAETVMEELDRKREFERPDLYIDNIAKQYLKVFEEALS